MGTPLTSSDITTLTGALKTHSVSAGYGGD
jgi:hypothetical protein